MPKHHPRILFFSLRSNEIDLEKVEKEFCYNGIILIDKSHKIKFSHNIFKFICNYIKAYNSVFWRSLALFVLPYRFFNLETEFMFEDT